MKGIKIDVIKKEIYEVEIGTGLQPMYDQLQCGIVEAVRIGMDEILWVDEEGLLRNQPFGAFKITIHSQVMSGHGLILGLASNGESCSTDLSVDRVRAMVTFVDIGRLPEPRVAVHTFETKEEFEAFLNQDRKPEEAQDN